MRDLHTGRDTRRTRGVLQVGDRVLLHGDRLPGGADLVGHRVDRDDTGAFLGRPGAEELAHALGGLGGGEDGRRVAVVDDGVQPADVTGLARVEQRHRDAARVQRAEERDEVLEVLRAQDGDPVAGLGHLLEAGADRAVAHAEVGPVQIPLDAVALGGEVQESVGDLVSTHLGPSFDVKNQAAVVGKPDLSVLDERVMEPHRTLLSKPHSSRRMHSREPSGRRGRRQGLRCPRGRRAPQDVTEASASAARPQVGRSRASGSMPCDQDFSPSRLSSVLVIS